ncbi:MAG: hypothetical protein R2827_09780 [Bdellovibrionales bacterium]
MFSRYKRTHVLSNQNAGVRLHSDPVLLFGLASGLCAELFVSQPADLVPNRSGHPALVEYLQEMNAAFETSDNPNHRDMSRIDESFGTIRVRSRHGRVDKDAEARVLAFAGQGANISRVDTVSELIGTLNRRETLRA